MKENPSSKAGDEVKVRMKKKLGSAEAIFITITRYYEIPLATVRSKNSTSCQTVGMYFSSSSEL